MDISIYLSLIAILLPLFFGFYLLGSRIKLALVNKKVLKFGLIVINSISLLIFIIIQYILCLKDEIFKYTNPVIKIEDIEIEWGVVLNQTNIKFLIFSSLMYLLFSIYLNLYFKKKKQFIFTKQRFYIFLSFLCFVTYAFFISSNLFSGIIFWISGTLLVFIFSYFDIFKNTISYNPSRFYRINLLGDFGLILSSAILYKYAFLSQGYINSISLEYDELNLLISYMYGLSNSLEFKICALCFVLAIISRMFIFPFSCYYSFFANSSNLLYICSFICVNCAFGMYLLLTMLPFEQLINIFVPLLVTICILTLISSCVFILFEKNIKIISGYIISLINAIFIALFVIYKNNNIAFIYLLTIAILAFILGYLFIKDKISLEKRIINKQKGFLLEKIHIFFFEILPRKIFKFFNFIDEKLIQGIISFIVILFNYLISLLVIRTMKSSRMRLVRNILIIFALILLFAIFVALFGRYK